jgi:hypothetical protein
MFIRTALILVALVYPCTLFGQHDLPSDSLAYTVNFDCGGFGSGFLVRTDTKVYLVTARHALFTEGPVPRKLRCEVAGMDQHSPTSMDRRRGNWFMMDMKQLQNNAKASETNDVAVVKIGDVVSSGGPQKAIQTEFLPLYSPNSPKVSKQEWIQFDPGAGLVEHVDKLVALRVDSVETLQQVEIGDSIYVFGSQAQLGYRNRYSLTTTCHSLEVASCRRRITVRVLDCLVFPGNSGGPVIGVKHEKHRDRVVVLGVVVQFVPVVLENAPSKNSGYSIAEPMDAVLQLLRN